SVAHGVSEIVELVKSGLRLPCGEHPSRPRADGEELVDFSLKEHSDGLRVGSAASGKAAAGNLTTARAIPRSCVTRATTELVRSASRLRAACRRRCGETGMGRGVSP